MLDTPRDWAATTARIFLSGIMLAHGGQKVLGFSGVMDYFTQTLHLPWIVGLGVVLVETIGALALLVGAAGRAMAAAMIAVMLGAIFMVHGPIGFFMDWGGTLAGEGFEFHLLAIGLGLVVVIRGSGALSVDRALLHAFPQLAVKRRGAQAE